MATEDESQEQVGPDTIEVWTNWKGSIRSADGNGENVDWTRLRSGRHEGVESESHRIV